MPTDDAGWPSRPDRYDPYDPLHPMWTDAFWGRYCTGPRTALPTERPSRQDNGNGRVAASHPPTDQSRNTST